MTFLHYFVPLRIDHDGQSFTVAPNEKRDFDAAMDLLRKSEFGPAVGAYNSFLQSEADSIQRFKQHQQASFDAERERWAAAGQDLVSVEEVAAVNEDTVLGEGEHAISSSVPGSLWQLPVQIGERVSAGDTVAVIESMKMEIPVQAHVSGEVIRLLCEPGTSLAPGQVLLVIREDGA